jgi:hypothetical protein
VRTSIAVMRTEATASKSARQRGCLVTILLRISLIFPSGGRGRTRVFTRSNPGLCVFPVTTSQLRSAICPAWVEGVLAFSDFAVGHVRGFSVITPDRRLSIFPLGDAVVSFQAPFTFGLHCYRRETTAAISPLGWGRLSASPTREDQRRDYGLLGCFEGSSFGFT